jgi:hypothetical protein
MSGFEKNGNPPQKEGEVKVKFNPNESSKTDSDVGEYVDFEEINDNDDSKKTK